MIPLPAKRPQGGGRRRVDDRAVLAVIVYLVQAGCSWWNFRRHVRREPGHRAPPVHRPKVEQQVRCCPDPLRGPMLDWAVRPAELPWCSILAPRTGTGWHCRIRGGTS